MTPNIFTEATLRTVDTGATSKARLLTELWTCLNIIEDYSETHPGVRPTLGDLRTIHRAVLKAQEVARRLEQK